MSAVMQSAVCRSAKGLGCDVCEIYTEGCDQPRYLSTKAYQLKRSLYGYGRGMSVADLGAPILPEGDPVWAITYEVQDLISIRDGSVYQPDMDWIQHCFQAPDAAAALAAWARYVAGSREMSEAEMAELQAGRYQTGDPGREQTVQMRAVPLMQLARLG